MEHFPAALAILGLALGIGGLLLLKQSSEKMLRLQKEENDARLQAPTKDRTARLEQIINERRHAVRLDRVALSVFFLGIGVLLAAMLTALLL